MTNIFFKKGKIKNINNKLKKNIDIYHEGSIRHFPAANIEWSNSIYAYNKNYIKFLPVYDKIVTNLIKSYFYIYHEKHKYARRKKGMSKRMKVLLRRLSTNRIFVSKAEIKHTNTRAIITLYIYNAEKRYLLNKLKNIDCSFLLYNKNLKKKIFLKKNIKKKYLYKKKRLAANKKLLKKIKKKSLRILKIYKKNFFFYLKEINKIKKTNKINKIYKYLLIQQYKIIIKRFIKIFLEKEKLIFHYNYLLWINKSKFENTYIYTLNKLIKKIYNKKIEFNLINLKYIYLNSNIFMQSIAIKLKNRKNRIWNVLRKSLYKVKLPVLDKNSKTYIKETDNKKLSTLTTNNLKLIYKLSALNISKDNNKKKDFLNQFLQKVFLNKKYKEKNYLVKKVLHSIEGKAISGVRIEARGRLTRRLIAARAISRFKYKGTLKNIDSSYKQLPSVMLRGHLKSNLQHTKISYKNRLGSFGLKGWINTL